MDTLQLSHRCSSDHGQPLRLLETKSEVFAKPYGSSSFMSIYFPNKAHPGKHSSFPGCLLEHHIPKQVHDKIYHFLRVSGATCQPKLPLVFVISVWTRPLVESFTQHLPRHIQRMLQQSSKGMYSKKRLADGRIQVTGGKRLKESGKYTSKFGRAIANHLLKRKPRAPCS